MAWGGETHPRECSCIKSAESCAGDDEKPSAGTTSYSLAECLAPVKQPLTAAWLKQDVACQSCKRAASLSCEQSASSMCEPRQTTSVPSVAGLRGASSGI